MLGRENALTLHSRCQNSRGPSTHLRALRSLRFVQDDSAIQLLWIWAIACVCGDSCAAWIRYVFIRHLPPKGSLGPPAIHKEEVEEEQQLEHGQAKQQQATRQH